MRKKTQNELALSGTRRLDRHGTKRAKVVTVSKIPDWEPYLSRKGINIYKRICEHLIKHNCLVKIDAIQISILAHSIDTYSRTMRQIMDKEKKKPGSGFFQVSESGYKNYSAEYNLCSSEMGTIKDYSKRYGLDLLARDKIIAFSKETEENKKEDPIAERMARRQRKQANE